MRQEDHTFKSCLDTEPVQSLGSCVRPCFKGKTKKAGVIAQWLRACLAYARPRVQTPFIKQKTASKPYIKPNYII